MRGLLSIEILALHNFLLPQLKAHSIDCLLRFCEEKGQDAPPRSIALFSGQLDLIEPTCALLSVPDAAPSSQVDCLGKLAGVKVPSAVDKVLHRVAQTCQEEASLLCGQLCQIQLVRLQVDCEKPGALPLAAVRTAIHQTAPWVHFVVRVVILLAFRHPHSLLEDEMSHDHVPDQSSLNSCPEPQLSTNAQNDHGDMQRTATQDIFGPVAGGGHIPSEVQGDSHEQQKDDGKGASKLQ
mmetsp:Transcript_42663/g.100064  ORF Transcript_42663/g.100064 Transcript_42663/m.100064 type:complete len:238 (+) Transcript_42663:919-1632(+)